MKVSCIQLAVLPGDPESNACLVRKKIEQAVEDVPDVIVLPETWNTGFFPREGLTALSDRDGRTAKSRIGALAKQYAVNIVAGSVSNLRNGRVYNTALVFDRQGECIAEYDKTHLFTPLEEDRYYTPGSTLCRFTLDGVACGLVTCYDLRFPELIRKLALPGLDMLFAVCQWPKARISHLQALTAARAIENQMFLVCCNGCGTFGDTVFGGNSAVIDPWGETLALAGEQEIILQAECEMSVLHRIRETIPVFADRRPELYRTGE